MIAWSSTVGLELGTREALVLRVVPSVASKHGHKTKKHVLIGC